MTNTTNNQKTTEKRRSYAVANAQPLTIEMLEEFLLCELGISSVRFNEISKQIDVNGGLKVDKNPQLLENLPAIAYSKLASETVLNNYTESRIAAYLNVLACRNSYNPVARLIDSVTWDKHDRLEEVYNILDIQDDCLSKTLVRKWLMQSFSMLYNGKLDEPFGADGVLVLTGRQGVGKTSFFRKISLKNNFFVEGACIDTTNKDSLINALSGWICELGELETTLKRDISALKAFLTAPVDNIRKPYGRTATRAVRTTSFCATCNSSDFLIDQTGNRRFWTVPVGEIDLKALEELDCKQLWAQISDLTLSYNSLQEFRLTPDEQKQLSERNTQHEKLLPSEAEVIDLLEEKSTKKYIITWEYMTVSDFKMQNLDTLGRYSVQQIGVALSHQGVDGIMVGDNKNRQRVRRLPMRHYQFERVTKSHID